MSLVKATSTGEHFLERVETTGDKIAAAAVQMYEKQVGSDGATVNTVYTLSSQYVIGSSTLMVFLNGQKIERVVAAALTTEYEETNATTVTIGASLQDTDVLEFIVAGAYVLDEIDSDNFKSLAAISASDHGFDGWKTTMYVGENVIFGDMLYLASDGKYWKSDANSDTTVPITAMATATILADASGVLLLFGFARDDSWNWTLGDGEANLLYASTTTGELTQTVPRGDQEQIVGIATHADRILFNPNINLDFNISDNLIGIAGDAGFGVGICPTQILPDGMIPLSGHDDPMSDNYGNYMYRDGSIMCWVPRFYYKISTLIIDVKGIDTYATEAAANVAGYAMHRAFIDGGTDQQGFFFDKYMCSQNAWGTGIIASSIPNGLPISTAAAHNPIATLTACGTNAYFEVIEASHARDGADGAINASSIFHVTTKFQRSAIAILSMAHGQAVSNTTNCAWYDATYNYPKGCNNDAFKDYDEVTNGAGSGADLLYVTDGYSNCGKTGSGVPFAKSTHNGQNCGVADVNGLMYEIDIGLVRSGTTNVEAINDALGTGKFYILKESVAAKDITSGWSTGAATPGSTAWGDAAYLEGATTSYDLIDLTMIGQAVGSIYFGNGAAQVLDASTSGAGWLRTGLGIYLDAGSSAVGTNLFGKDGCYEYWRSNFCVRSCGYWNPASAAGVWYVYFRHSRTHSSDLVGLRCACYPE